MPLTPSQKTAVKNDIAANTNTVTYAGNTVQIKDLPNNSDANFAIAAWYNQTATPDYWGWKPTISRADIYDVTSPDATTWNWGTYKAQAVAEQNAWVQMFMGDSGTVANVNWRAGVQSIFTGSVQQNAQRDHVFAVGRRLVNRVEKLFCTAVVNPPANTGNNTGNPRGSATNPDNIIFKGTVSTTDIEDARNQG